jgi:hypothetical protein
MAMPYSIDKGKELYAAGKLHGQWSAPEILDIAGSLKAFRDSLKPKVKKTKVKIIIFIISSVIFGVLTFAWSFFFLIFLLASIALAVVFIVKAVKWNDDRFNPDAESMLTPLFTCIGPDLAKNSPATLSAALRSPFEKEFLVKEGQKYSTFAYPECIDRFYKRPVLSLECRLLDGTRLMAGIVEHSIEKVLKKKNPRGKWKTKKKYRRKLGIRVRIQLDRTRTSLTGEFKLPSDAVARVRHSPRGDVILLSLRRIVKDTKPLNASALLDLMAGAYRAVTPVPSEQTQSGGNV